MNKSFTILEKLALKRFIDASDYRELKKDSTSWLSILDRAATQARIVEKAALISAFIKATQQYQLARLEEEFYYKTHLAQMETEKQAIRPAGAPATPASGPSLYPSKEAKTDNEAEREWLILCKTIKNHPLDNQATVAQVVNRHQQILTNWNQQVLAQLGTSVVLSPERTLIIPPSVATAAPTAGQILNYNTGLAEMVMEASVKDVMLNAFVEAYTKSQTGHIGVLSLTQKILADQPELSLADRKKLIALLDKKANLINKKAINKDMTTLLKENNDVSIPVIYRPKNKVEENTTPPPPAPPPP